MHNILIIVAGQLGSRHLQGAVQSKLPLHIYVVNPSIASLEVAELRANQITFGYNKTCIQFNQGIEESIVIEICNIANTANVRFQVFLELIGKCTVKNINFEKILFQKEAEYMSVQSLLSSNKIKAWINCPRRLNPIYQKIRDLLAIEKKFYGSNRHWLGLSW